MTNRVWHFSSVQHHPRPDSVAHMWQWRVEVDGEIRRSRTFFYTLDDCVKDAQHNGFKGQLSASDSYGQTSYRRESTDDEGNPAPHG
jgi:hypothetical protein